MKTTDRPRFLRAALYLLLLLAAAALAPAARAQKIAVLTPEKSARAEGFAGALAAALGRRFKVLDADLAAAAFGSAEVERPYNMTTDEARTAGAAIGGEFFVLVRAVGQPRQSFEKKEYFESYAAVYLVSARTGRLVFWKLASFDAPDAAAADRGLLAAADAVAAEIAARAAGARAAEIAEKPAGYAEPPDPDSPAAKDFRAPLPYRRISPPYAATANLYGVAATVDVAVELDETGAIRGTEITRWAGYGLDEAVVETVRKMNWRPATRAGRPVPVRFLLRYNFRKIDKEE